MTKKEKPLSHGQVALLGAEKLAEILLDAVWRDEALEGRLRRELAARGPDDGLAALIRSQLHELARHDFVSWREASQLAGEIDALRQSIVENVLPSSPRLAADLLGEIASEEGAILEGVDDSGGDVGGALERIVGDWGAAWAAVDDRDPDAIANIVLEALEASDYGTRDGIVTAFGNALGGDGLQRIEDLTRSVMKSRPRDTPTGTPGTPSGAVFAVSSRTWQTRRAIRTFSSRRFSSTARWRCTGRGSPSGCSEPSAQTKRCSGSRTPTRTTSDTVTRSHARRRRRSRR